MIDDQDDAWDDDAWDDDDWDVDGDNGVDNGDWDDDWYEDDDGVVLNIYKDNIFFHFHIIFS